MIEHTCNSKECSAGSSVVDWVQGLVTKALSELQVSKHKTGQYTHNIIITMYQK